jgi:hypothetical protein
MSASKYRLHYTCLGAQSLDFDGLKLYAKTSIELHDYVKGEYGKV